MTDSPGQFTDRKHYEWRHCGLNNKHLFKHCYTVFPPMDPFAYMDLTQLMDSKKQSLVPV